MGGAGGVNHQAAAVAHVGQVAENFQRFNEGTALCTAALDVKTEHRARAARPELQELVRQCVAGMRFDERMPNAADHGVCSQKRHHFFGVAHVSVHAQRQGFDALQNQPCAVWAQTCAKVAQTFAARTQQECAHGALFAEHHVVKTFVALREFRKFPTALPIEAATIDHDAANHRAVTAQKFGGRVVDQIGPPSQRLNQVGRGEGGVHQQRHARFVRDA